MLSIFNEGDEMGALELEKECLSLSLGVKQLHPDPWVGLGERLAVGSRIKGRITEITEYGTFVEIEPGVEGRLVGRDFHEKRHENSIDGVAEGREVHVQVLLIDVQTYTLLLATSVAPCGIAESVPGNKSHDEKTA